MSKPTLNANPSVFFSPQQIFFNSIFCQPGISKLTFAPTAQTNPSGNSPRVVSASTLPKNDDSYLICQVNPDYFTINSNIFTESRRLT